MSSFWKGLGFGAAAGGILGLLYAPQSGKELQETIKNFTDETGLEIETLKHDFQNVQEQSQKLRQVQQEVVAPTLKDLDQTLDAFDFQAQSRLKSINQQAEKIQSHLNGNS